MRKILAMAMLVCSIFLSSSAFAITYHYDTLGRVTETIYDNGDHKTTSYYYETLQSPKYIEEYRDVNDMWKWTMEYYPQNIQFWDSRRYLSCVDPNPGSDGDIVFYEFYIWRQYVLNVKLDNGNEIHYELGNSGIKSKIFTAPQNGIAKIDYYDDANWYYTEYFPMEPAPPYAYKNMYGRISKETRFFADFDGCMSHTYSYYGTTNNVSQKRGYLDANATQQVVTYGYNQSSGLLDSIAISSGQTLALTGNISVTGSVSGNGNLNVQNGNLTAASINVNTLTIGPGCTVTIAALPGGPQASGAIRPLNQEASDIIGINTNQGNLYGAGGISVSPQIAGQPNNAGTQPLKGASGQ